MAAGALLYAIGLVMMAFSTSGIEFGVSAGIVVGIALSCSGFSIVYGVIARAFPVEKRSTALGLAGAAGSFGQFVMLLYGQTLITHIGWHSALITLAVTILLILPLSAALAEKRVPHPPDTSSSRFPKRCAKRSVTAVTGSCASPIPCADFS